MTNSTPQAIVVTTWSSALALITAFLKWEISNVKRTANRDWWRTHLLSNRRRINYVNQIIRFG